jgi:hypothetical protein
VSRPELTEAEATWLAGLRDGHGPSGTVDPHDIRELVRLAQRLVVTTNAEQARLDRENDERIAQQLDRVAAYYRTDPRKRNGQDVRFTVRSLLTEFVNGWSL